MNATSYPKPFVPPARIIESVFDHLFTSWPSPLLSPLEGQWATLNGCESAAQLYEAGFEARDTLSGLTSQELKEEARLLATMLIAQAPLHSEIPSPRDFNADTATLQYELNANTGFCATGVVPGITPRQWWAISSAMGGSLKAVGFIGDGGIPVLKKMEEKDLDDAHKCGNKVLYVFAGLGEGE